MTVRDWVLAERGLEEGKGGDMKSLRGREKDSGYHGLPLWAWTGLNPKEEKLGKLREVEAGESEG